MLNFLIDYSGIILTLNVWIFLVAPIFFTNLKQDLWKKTISEGTTKHIFLNKIISIFLVTGGLLQMLFSYFLFIKSEQLNSLPSILFGFLGFLAFIESFFTKKSFPRTHYIIVMVYFISFPVNLILFGLIFPNSFVFFVSFLCSFIYCLGCAYFIYKKYMGTYLEVFIFGVLGVWAIIVNLLLI